MRSKSDFVSQFFCGGFFIFIEDIIYREVQLVLGHIYRTHKNVKQQLLTITKAWTYKQVPVFFHLDITSSLTKQLCWLHITVQF